MDQDKNTPVPVPDPGIRSNRARDRTSTALAHTIKTVREEDVFFSSLKTLVGSNRLHVLVAKNRSYKERGRPSNFGGKDQGKAGMVGVPTGGGEAREATPNISERECFHETGYRTKWIILPLYEFVAMRKIRGTNPQEYHPHYPYLVEAETDYVEEIREKDEIEWARYVTFCEIIYRLKLGKKAFEEGRINPEAFYYSHARDFLIPFYFKVYYMTPEEIASEKSLRYREWLTRFRPYIVEEINEHAEELLELKLVPRKYLLGNDGNPVPIEDTTESISSL